MILNIQLKGTSVNQHCMYKVTLPVGKSLLVSDAKILIHQYIRSVQSRSETHNLSYILNLLDVETEEIDLCYQNSMLNDHESLEKSLSIINDINLIAKKDDIILLLSCRTKRYSIDIRVVNPPMIERSIDSIDQDFIINISLTGDNIYKINAVADLMGEIYDTRNSNVKKHYDIYHQCLTFDDELIPPDLSIKELCKNIQNKPLQLKLNEFSLSHIITKHFKIIGNLKRFNDKSEFQGVIQYIEGMLTACGVRNNSAETITLTKFVSYAIASIVLLLFSTIAIILYVGTIKPYFIIQVSNCANNVDEASYYRSDWTLSMLNAFCPINSLDNCISFSDRTKWETLDSDNHHAGHTSNLRLGADEWLQSSQTIKFAYVSLFIAEIFAGTLVLHSSNIIDLSRWKIHKNIQYFMSTIILIVHIYVFFIIVGALLMLNNTDQRVALSWSTYMFDTCDIEVVRSEGFELCKYCAVVCGLLLLFCLISGALCVYNRCIECENEAISKSTDESVLQLSDGDGNPMHKHPSLCRQQSTIVMTVNPALSRIAV